MWETYKHDVVLSDPKMLIKRRIKKTLEVENSVSGCGVNKTMIMKLNPKLIHTRIISNSDFFVR